jgi:hypothetical protein
LRGLLQFLCEPAVFSGECTYSREQFTLVDLIELSSEEPLGIEPKFIVVGTQPCDLVAGQGEIRSQAYHARRVVGSVISRLVGLLSNRCLDVLAHAIGIYEPCRYAGGPSYGSECHRVAGQQHLFDG